MKYLQNEESFSFNSTSSTGLFSDDEEGGAVGNGLKRGPIYSHQQNNYFEISLSPTPPPPQSPEKEFEFCSSISSSSTLFSFPVSTSPHPKPPTTNSSTIEELHVAKDYKYHNRINNLFNNNQGCMIRSPRCHQGLISPYVDGKQVMRLRIIDKNQRNSAPFGGIRNFMVKVTSIKSMLRDAKSRRLQQSPIDKINKKTYMDCKLNKSDIQKDSSHITTKNNKNQNKQEEKSSRSGFNNMFNVFMKNIGIGRRSKKVGTKSCPVSIKSSPMHDTNVGNTSDERRNSFYSRDHSIQAAIAHCKKSFGR